MEKKDALRIVKKMLTDEKIKTNEEYLGALNFMISQVNEDKSELIQDEVKKVQKKYENIELAGTKEVVRSSGLKKGFKK